MHPIALELARELAQTHPVFLAGRPTPHLPDAVFRLASSLYRAFVTGVLTRATPIGRKVAMGFHSRGAPLVRISMKQVKAAGVQRLPHMTGIADGQPIADGAVESMPGLFFVGMPFQYGLTSALLGGVGRDAGWVVGRLAEAQ